MARPGDHIVFPAIDRGFRNVNDCLHWFEVWNRRGVHLHVLNFGGNQLDLGTPIGRLVFRVLAVLAELERDIRSERNREVHRRVRELGRAANGRPRPGWVLKKARDGVGFTMTPDPEARTLMADIVAWQDAGWTMDQIRQHLSYTLRVKPLGRSREWSVQNLAKIIMRERQYQAAEKAALAAVTTEGERS
jgi:DNA invertase Pin-like site-specific DNA recombinase